MPVTIKPENIIDRDVEQDVFSELLQLTRNARVLTIKDEEGTGKTELLKRLRYNCRYRMMPITPVSLVPLDEIKGDDSFLLVSRIREDLSEVEFPEFDRLKLALVDEKFSSFEPRGSSSVNASGATVSGNDTVFAGEYHKLEAETINVQYGTRQWGDKRDTAARQACTRAFFADLKKVAATTSLVIMFDSYDDRCDDTLKDLIWTELIIRAFNVAQRPGSLILVVAGRQLPDIKGLLRDKYDELVLSRDSLRGWQQDHLRDFLTLHGFGNLTDEEFNFIWSRVEQGLTILKALGLADVFVSTRPKPIV